MIYLLSTMFLTIHAVRSMDGGTPGEQAEFKYLVFIKRFNEYLCSGTIIHESHILTIGHVVTNVNSSELVVFGGLLTEAYTSFTLFLVEHVYFHSQFRKISIAEQQLNGYWENDIALLKLKHKISWAPNIGPVQLIDRDIHWHSCALFACQIVSWHHSIQYCGNSVAPMWHFTDILDNHTCYQWNMLPLTDEECFIDPLRTAIISSQDLGSPIICDNVMVGLTVRTNNSETAGTPSIFLSTFSYRAFITEIINGGQFDARLGEFPYVVSIWANNSLQCGGIILDATHILSAGRCFQEWRYIRYHITPRYTTIRGFDCITPGIVIKNVKYAPRHKPVREPGSSELRRRHDMAVVTLTEPVLWEPTIVHIDLSGLVFPPSGHICEVLHWKHTQNEIGGFSIKLKKSNVVILDDAACKRLGVRPRLNEFCARNPYSLAIADPKDSGNPIICGGRPIGIVVQTYAPPRPTIFLEIEPYIRFLTETMSTT